MTTKTAKEGKSIWKLLSGLHQDKYAQPVSIVEVGGIERSLEDWDNIPEGVGAPCFYPGDVFQSDKDLDDHNQGRKDVRFEKLQEAPDELDSMNVKQLQDFIDEEELEDIPKNLAKGKLISAIRAKLQFNEAVTT